MATGHVSRSAVSPPQSNSTSASRPSMEEVTEQRLSFAYLMGDEDDAAALAVTEGEEEQFELTQSGRELLSRLVASSPPNTRSLLESIETEATGVRRRFGAWPLQRLLRYVYSEYPDMTTASEIKGTGLGTPLNAATRGDRFDLRALCGWFGWELLLLGALAQFKTSAELKERVSRRTFQRLSDLKSLPGRPLRQLAVR